MSFPKLSDPTHLHTLDLSLCVPDTSHSLSSIVAILRPQIGNDETIRMVEANPIDGQGIMSTIHRITIHLDSGGTFVAILKVATTAKMERLNPIEDAKRSRKETASSVEIGEHFEEKAKEEGKEEGGWNMELFRMLLLEMFELEVNFYKEIVPRISASVHLFPRSYYARFSSSDNLEKGLLLMEDISEKGVPTNFYEGFSPAQIESTILFLAKFHAFSMSLPAELLCRFRVNLYGNLAGMEEQLVERVLNLPGSEYFRIHRSALLAFMQKNNRMKTDVHAKLGVRAVLSHGDLWGNNLFFERRKGVNGEWVAGDKLSAIIDWQTCHQNTGLNDVIRLIFSGVNAKLREENIDKWVDLYFERFEEESRRLDIFVEYPKGMRRKMFDEQCPFELTFCLMCFPTLFPEAKNERHQRNLMERMETLFQMYGGNGRIDTK